MAEYKRVMVHNLAPWQVSFPRKTMNGDVVIPANGRMYLDEQEVMMQFYANNVLFIGTDGRGTHARIYIEDADIRKALNFDSQDGTTTQEIVTDELLKKIFAYKRQSDFEKAIKEHVVAHFEKFMLADFIQRNDVNDYKKIRFVEEYAGVKMT